MIAASFLENLETSKDADRGNRDQIFKKLK
jgi:hypothetical protein